MMGWGGGMSNGIQLITGMGIPRATLLVVYYISIPLHDGP